MKNLKKSGKGELNFTKEHDFKMTCYSFGGIQEPQMKPLLTGGKKLKVEINRKGENAVIISWSENEGDHSPS